MFKGLDTELKGLVITISLYSLFSLKPINNKLHNKPAKSKSSKISKWGIKKKYLWKDLTTLLAIYDKDNNLIYRFEYAEGRMPIAMTDKNNNRYYLHYDQVGSLRAITDNNGNIVKEIVYDSYGNIINDTNPDFKVSFGFAGGLYDSDTKLVHFGFREYDPAIGRWLSKDPLLFGGGDSNLYGYVLQDPVNLVDPLGLWTFGLSLNFSYGAGAGGTIGIDLVIDGHGNLELQWIRGYGGHAGVGGGVTVDVEVSNAECVGNLTGDGFQHGADLSLGADIEGGHFGGEGYNGAYLGLGVGIELPDPVPVGYSVYKTHTETILKTSLW